MNQVPKKSNTGSLCVDFLVSTCIARDLTIWQFAAPKILENINSKTYHLVVPAAELDTFRALSPSEFEIVSEEDVLGGRDLNWVRGILPSSLSGRAGWYYQQLLKLEFLRNGEAGKIGLIWDADTIPLRPLEFIDSQGRLIFRYGVHRPRIHEPYFKLIDSLLGIQRQIDESFISQCMPARVEWVQALCREIEWKSGQDWKSTILGFIAGNPSACGFSEYETLGTFAYANHRESIVCQSGAYYRPANYFCSPREVDGLPFSRFKDSQEYLAFDGYMCSSEEIIGGLNVGCGNTKMQAFDGSKSINVDRFATEVSDLILDVNNGLPFRDKQFNHIVAHNILEHVDDLFATLVELDRVLRSGGVLQIEVPHLGSYNHGTHVTHRRGLTFDSFNFLFNRFSYLFPRGNSPFNYTLISFNRENIIEGRLIRETFDSIPVRGTYSNWLESVRKFEIPGTFGFIFRKI